MKKLYYVINGSNLNMLGIREPDIYDTESYAALRKSLRATAKALGVRIRMVQSNHEGYLVDAIQAAYYTGAHGIIINPGAYTHTSIAIMDAIKATGLPTVEVHVSNIDEREAFRQTSYVRLAAEKTISGHGIKGYSEALEYLVNKYN